MNMESITKVALAIVGVTQMLKNIIMIEIIQTIHPIILKQNMNVT